MTQRYPRFDLDRNWRCGSFRAHASFWGVVRSLPKREAFAAERLRMDGGFEVFLPLVQTKRASQPLFSGYFFCRIVDRWRSINSTLGVLCLVRTGDCPARCPDNEIDRLRALIDGHGFVRLPEAPGATGQTPDCDRSEGKGHSRTVRRDVGALRRPDIPRTRAGPAQCSRRAASGVDRRQPCRLAMSNGPQGTAELRLLETLQQNPGLKVVEVRPRRWRLPVGHRGPPAPVGP